MEKLEICPVDDSYKIAESTVMIREAFDYVLNKRQMDLIYAVISLVQRTDDKFKEYKISFREIGAIYNPKNPDSKEIKKYVEEATNKIMDSHFQITLENGDIKKFHWVESCLVSNANKEVTFKLNDEVRNFYLDLKENSYTIYLLKDLLALSTLFQANVFRWLSCNSNFNNKIKISIDDAKQMFYGGEIETKTFIRRLNNALDAIGRKTNIEATYTKVKKGKNIVALDFNIENNYVIDYSGNIKSPEQYAKESQRKKAMWQENLEMRRKIIELEKELEESKKR